MVLRGHRASKTQMAHNRCPHHLLKGSHDPRSTLSWWESMSSPCRSTETESGKWPIWPKCRWGGAWVQTLLKMAIFVVFFLRLLRSACVDGERGRRKQKTTFVGSVWHPRVTSRSFSDGWSLDWSLIYPFPPFIFIFY